MGFEMRHRRKASFEELTRNHVGKKLRIVFDGLILTHIAQALLGGGIINGGSGGFTEDEVAELAGRIRAIGGDVPAVPTRRTPALPRVQQAARADARVIGLHAPVFPLGLGLVLAQVFTLGQCSCFAWFLSSLVHELGHSAVSLLTAAPCFPVIRLDGHAMALSGSFSYSFAVAVWIGLAVLAWHVCDVRVYYLPLLALIALGAFATLVAGRETLILLMGHGGELVFAGLFFLRCLDTSDYERGDDQCALYSVAAWYLVLSNATLFFGLATSQAAVIDYYGSGSLGLTNDFDRLALGMLVACAGTLPLACLVHRWRPRSLAL
ncbi:MAG: hypothetical protein ACI841_004772 [Planctomycetota bacterium]|jgi:hypothetical protein